MAKKNKLGQELSDNALPVNDEDREKAYKARQDEDTDEDQDWKPPVEEETAEKKKPGRPPKEKAAPKEPRKKKSIEVRSCTLKNSLFCKYGYDHNLGPATTNKTDVTSEVPVHEDMIKAFRGFVPHLAVIFGALDSEDLLEMHTWDAESPKMKILQSFTVQGFKLADYDDEEAIVIHGTWMLETGAAALETPKIRFESSKYELFAGLRAVTNAVIFEIEEYMHGRKKAPDQQLTLGLTDM